MSPQDEVAQLLREHGATLKREGKHRVWIFPNGKTFTQSKTPSDHRGVLNALADLKALLGLQAPDRGRPGERRHKKYKSAPVQEIRRRGPSVELEHNLRLAGLKPATLGEQISALLNEVRKTA
jgi:hypothetical protein